METGPVMWSHPAILFSLRIPPESVTWRGAVSAEDTGAATSEDATSGLAKNTLTRRRELYENWLCFAARRAFVRDEHHGRRST